MANHRLGSRNSNLAESGQISLWRMGFDEHSDDVINHVEDKPGNEERDEDGEHGCDLVVGGVLALCRLTWDTQASGITG